MLHIFCLSFIYFIFFFCYQYPSFVWPCCNMFIFVAFIKLHQLATNTIFIILWPFRASTTAGLFFLFVPPLQPFLLAAIFFHCGYLYLSKMFHNLQFPFYLQFPSFVWYLVVFPTEVSCYMPIVNLDYIWSML